MMATCWPWPATRGWRSYARPTCGHLESSGPGACGDFYWGHLRLAWLDGGGVLHVGEAGHLDKGPYRELASGPLPAGGALAVTLYDGPRAACRVTFADWAAQAGRALPPDAGYGLPVNAAQFSRYRADPPGQVTLALTLVGTEVGRGRDSVGHAAGTYRNRLRVEPCPSGERGPGVAAGKWR